MGETAVAQATNTSAEPRRTLGRPRSAGVDRAILTSTLDLLSCEGYAGLSLEAIAAQAGVSKAAIYRRYRDKKELVVAAMSDMINASMPLVDTGDTRADLAAMLRLWRGVIMRGAVYPMVGALLVEQQRNPELLDLFRERVMLPACARMHAIIQQGIARGEVRADVDPDTVIDMIGGAAFQRHIAGTDASETWVDDVLDVIWHGLTSDQT
jgi:AcrR family transcriptional regulator